MTSPLPLHAASGTALDTPSTLQQAQSYPLCTRCGGAVQLGPAWTGTPGHGPVGLPYMPQTASAAARASGETQAQGGPAAVTSRDFQLPGAGSLDIAGALSLKTPGPVRVPVPVPEPPGHPPACQPGSA
eukprot:3261167-Rhodomonas_salina.2